MKTALTIAGSDSGGGAGIQADLKTFEAHRVFGLTVITSITAQNTVGVQGVWDLSPKVIGEQLRSVFDDFPVDAIKIGMLSNVDIISVVAKTLEERAEGIPLVLDPVMVATSGDRLLKEDAVDKLISRLLPLATLITPNVKEAEVLAKGSIRSIEEAWQSGERMRELGGANVLITGGDIEGKKSIDLLMMGSKRSILEGERVESRHTHGTGCTLSSAIAANLALGIELEEAVIRAKNYVYHAIVHAPQLGKGHGPLRHELSETEL